MDKPIYLDYAAATPVADEAVESIKPYLKDRFYNPSAVYQAARNVRSELELYRSKVAQVLGAKPQEIICTAGGTEANNMAINGVMSHFADAEIIVSSVEHESVLEPANRYKKVIAPVDERGIVNVEALKSLITSKTALISVMYANNEIGTIQPIKLLSELVNTVRTQRSKGGNSRPIFLHTDACQAANYLDLHISRLGVDLMTLNGGKIYAMKQSGCLYVKSGVELEPLVLGGGQEEGLRSGTENVAAISSFATMLQNVQATRKSESERLTMLRDRLFAKLSQSIDGLNLNGHATKRLPNNLNFTIPGVDGERLLMELDNAGLMVATGSACTASSDEPSHVLKAIGLSNEEASASLRITLGRQTTEDEIERAASIILGVLTDSKNLIY
jgi:cysteine desulfurase